ncbi:hypothetical protein [Corallococcus llansteffanensis]|uniref:Uncharacterized protein n=1 Tax=Corallococcus llansteffanensis TaxID=2316731 RepID=A0A3A8PDD1_9BACT|nr:hypothetical protein [Corallococcus llansteffanensis]RKH53959.1 hypothetical protein D7V93_26160 [Corallococcus llansteffanensis]
MLLNDPISNSGDAAFSKHRHLDGSALAQAMDQHSCFDSEWMNANAQAFVAKVKQSGRVLEIEPTHPAWIEHLRKGMAWRTTAYDAGPGLPAAPRAPAPRGAPSRHSQDPAAGFRVGRPHHPNDNISGAFIALYGPNRYVADPELTDPAAMKDAAGKMLGQPLLLVPKRGPKQVGTLVLATPKQALLYQEAADWHGSQVVDFDDLKSLGRAWLLQDDAATASEPTAKTGSGGAKKAPSKNGARKAAKKAGSKGGAKKAAKKAAAKVGSKAGAKKAAKVGSKAGAKKAATAGSKAGAKEAAKVGSKAGAKKAAKGGKRRV